MTEPYTLSGSTVAYTGLTLRENSSETPFVWLAGGKATYDEDIDDWHFSTQVQGWVGTNSLLDNKPEHLVPSWGYEDKAAYFMNRSVFGKNFGINHMAVSMEQKDTGVKFTVAPFWMIEQGYFPYSHNVALGHPSTQQGVHDGNAGADLFNPFIGPALRLDWAVPSIAGLKTYVQAGTAGSDPLNLHKLFKSAGAVYTVGSLDADDAPVVGGKKIQLDVGAYYMTLDPDKPVTDDGYRVSPSSGAGLGANLQVKDTLDLGVGYSKVSQVIGSLDGDVTTALTGLTLSGRWYFGGNALQVCYSTLATDQTDAQKFMSKQIDNTRIVSASVVIPVNESKSVAIVPQWTSVFRDNDEPNRSTASILANWNF